MKKRIQTVLGSTPVKVTVIASDKRSTSYFICTLEQFQEAKPTIIDGLTTVVTEDVATYFGQEVLNLAYRMQAGEVISFLAELVQEI